MAQDPAFLFYPNDFDAATKFFTNEQIGVYMRLLIAQFQHGRLTEKQFLHIAGDWDSEIMQKFKRDEDGKYYNQRLEKEQDKRKKYSESRRKNVQTRYKTDSYVGTHKSTYVGTHEKSMYPHMENENISINNSLTNSKTGAKNAKEEMIVVEMSNIWKKHITDYVYHKETDYHALLQIAYFIAEQKGWKRSSVIDEHEKDVMESWEIITKYISSDECDDFFKKLTLEGISKPKNLQSIQMNMKVAKKNKSDLNALESRRITHEEYFTD